MEIAVSSASPLGQYLAEIDAGADGGMSAAQLLAAPRQVNNRPQRRRPATASATCSALRRWREVPIKLHRRVQLLMLQRLIPELTPIHPTIREELQQAVGRSDAAVLALPTQKIRHLALTVLLNGVDSRLFGGIRRGNNVLVGTVAVTLLAVIAATREGSVPLVLQAVGWIVVIFTLLLVILELSVRLLLACHAQRSLRLLGSFRAFVGALERFNTIFDNNLVLVKRAELASRGYRLGAGLLPPIGRLEITPLNAGKAEGGDSEEAAAKHQLRCLPLRRRLRTLNDLLHERASSFLHSISSEENAAVKDQENADEDGAGDFQAPSLLLTALAKQHSRGAILLESAVHIRLIQNLARACSCQRAAGACCSVFGVLGAQRFAVDRLIGTLNGWSSELEAWNASNNPASLLSAVLGSDTSERQQQKSQAPSDSGNPRLKGITTQLQELRSVGETLGALVIAAQYELLSPESATESLMTSREAMGSLVQQLQDVWGSYDTTLHALTAGEETQTSDISCTNMDEGRESQSLAVTLPSSSVPSPLDADCIVVFTGTSTGDEGFDLQVLLNQREVGIATASAPSKPSFVRELRDVLAYRQAHTGPRLTKQVNHDTPVSLLPAASSNTPPLPPTDPLFALPRAPPRRQPRRAPPDSTPTPASREFLNPEVDAFTTELQALLQRSLPVQNDVLESLGDSVSDSDSEIAVGSETESKEPLQQPNAYQ